jgi:hypothetical protein
VPAGIDLVALKSDSSHPARVWKVRVRCGTSHGTGYLGTPRWATARVRSAFPAHLHHGAMTSIVEGAHLADTLSSFPMAARGPLSARLMGLLSRPATTASSDTALQGAVGDALLTTRSVLHDDDIQLCLLVLHGLHYVSFATVEEGWEWQPSLAGARRAVESAFEAELRRIVPRSVVPEARVSAVGAALTAVVREIRAPDFAGYMAKSATREQLSEYLIHRSVSAVLEPDVHAWAIPHFVGNAKVALAGIQARGYGDGHLSRTHSAVFVDTMQAAGLDPGYGRYMDSVPAITLASLNMGSMFGFNRRLRGAFAGHLASAEMTMSSTRNRMYGNGFRRAGYGTAATAYFDLQASRRAVHESIAAYEVAGALAEEQPALLRDIIFGADAYLAVNGSLEDQMLDAWTAGKSFLREAVA